MKKTKKCEKSKKKKFVIYAHGLLSDGTDIGLKITDYTPYFFFKIPESWNIRNISRFVIAISKKMYPDHLQDSLIDYKKVYRKQFYYFTLDKNGKRHKQFPLLK